MTSRLDALRDKMDQHAVDQNKQMNELRRELTGKIEAADTKVDTANHDLTDRIDTIRTDLTNRIETVRTDLTGRIETLRTDLTNRIDSVRTDLTARIDTVHTDLTGKIDSVKQSLASAKVWALLLYFALAGSLLAVLARGFKWI